MTRKTALAVGTLALLVLLAGCVSGFGGGDAQSEEESPLLVTHSIVAGNEGIPEDTDLVKPCVRTGTFYQGMQPAWHVAVVDPETGEKLTNETVDSVRAELSNGMTAEMEFNEDDMNWHGCVVLPEDEEPGEITYKIVVDAENYKTVETTSNAFEVVESP